MKFKFYEREFDSNEIDYIKLLIKYKDSSKLYYFVVSNNGHEETLFETKTIDDFEVYTEYIKLKRIAPKLGLLEAKSGENQAFINPLNAKVLKVKNNFFKRKYLQAEYGLIWDDERMFITKTESRKSDRWEKIVIDFEKYKNEKRKQEQEQKFETSKHFLPIKYYKQNSERSQEELNDINDVQEVQEFLDYQRILKQQKKDKSTQNFIDQYNEEIDEEMEK